MVFKFQFAAVPNFCRHKYVTLSSLIKTDNLMHEKCVKLIRVYMYYVNKVEDQYLHWGSVILSGGIN